MKASELIKELEKAIEEHGNQHVLYYDDIDGYIEIDEIKMNHDVWVMENSEIKKGLIVI